MKKIYQVLLHVVYWFYTFGWQIITSRWYQPNAKINWGKYFEPFSMSTYALAITTFYLNYFIILPAFLKPRKYGALWLSWIGLYAYFIGARYLVEEVLYFKWFGVHNYHGNVTADYYIIDNLYFGGVYIVMSIVIWSVIHFAKNEKEKNQLAEERNAAEISFLKSQVNPHFLFNTLNNIYSLVYHRSDKALPAIVTLSELMRYMTNESAMPQISISKEITYIRSFIELESLRTTQQAAVTFDVSIEDEAQMIAPLLLIPFVENGFKHGVITDPAHPFTIDLAVRNSRLTLVTRNLISQHQKDHSGGIGMTNVRRRLALLYPGHHTLDIREDNGYYICELFIKL